MERIERLTPDWLLAPGLQRLLATLSDGGEEARAIGGAVRNEIMGEPIADVDVGTTLLPEAVMRRASRAGFHAVPTGIAHGTVTVVVEGAPVEVTTLRRDVATFGRHAEVAFTRDWSEDAHRRDLTVNALSLDATGLLHDYVGGIADCRARRIRFIGDAGERMREDYLRILRFFRIHARYGSGPLDPAGLAAAERERHGLAVLSAERIQAELFRLLSAPGVGPVVRAMRPAGILEEVLPAPFDAEALARAVDADARIAALAGRPAGAPEPRLAALTLTRDAGRAEAIAERLKLSQASRQRMARAVAAREALPLESPAAARAEAYRRGVEPLLDAAILAHADGVPLAAATAFLGDAVAFGHAAPALPVSGRLLIEAGLAGRGPRLGRLLRTLEGIWIESDFGASREELLRTAARLARGDDEG